MNNEDEVEIVDWSQFMGMPEKIDKLNAKIRKRCLETGEKPFSIKSGPIDGSYEVG